MLRRMCKVCKEVRPWMYTNKELTGEVVKKIKDKDYIVTVMTCSVCKHIWTYSKSRKKSK